MKDYDLNDDRQMAAAMKEIVNRQKILDCLTSALRAIDRFDRDLFEQSFHEDALIDSGMNTNLALKCYDVAAAQHDSGQTSTLHNLLNHSCEIDGDVAHAETYLLFTGVNRDRSNWVAGGRYLDRLERRGGPWKIAFRYTLIEWSGIIPGATNPMYDNFADVHVNGVPSRSADDPSYRRPLFNRRELNLASDPHNMPVAREL